VKSNTDKL